MDTVLRSWYKWWTWAGLDFFNGKVKFGSLDFGMEKCEKVDLSGAVVLSDVNIALELNSYEILEVKVILWPWPNNTSK